MPAPPTLSRSGRRRTGGDSQARELKQLVLAARRDPLAHDRLAAELHRLCPAFLRGLFPDENDLADATQISVTHLLARLDAYDGRRRLLPWLRTVTRRKGLEYRAALDRRHARLGSASIDEVADRSREPLSEDDRAAIHRALSRLPDSDRELIIARYWRDQILEEMARDHQVVAATVHRRIARALGALRVLLAGPLGMEPSGR